MRQIQRNHELYMKKIILALAITSVGLMSCEENGENSISNSSNEDLTAVDVNTDSESEKFSYSMGMIIGNTLKNNDVDSVNYGIVNRAFDDSENEQMAYMLIAREVQSLTGEEVDLNNVDQSVLKRGIYDVLENDTTLLTMPEMNTSYRGYLENNNLKVGERNLEKGKSFLESNKANEGVQVTDSGLQYQLIEEGSGEALTADDVVLVDLTGTSIHGEEFINTADQGQPLPVDLGATANAGGLSIPGLVEALQLVPAGSKLKVFIPSNLAFGDQRLSPEVGPNSTIIFDIQDVQPMSAEQKQQYLQQMEQQRQMMQQMQRQQMQQQGAQ